MAQSAPKPADRLQELKERIAHDFVYHPPNYEQQERYGALRAKGMELALLIAETTPISREQSLALTNLELAIMWSCASIARNT